MLSNPTNNGKLRPDVDRSLRKHPQKWARAADWSQAEEMIREHFNAWLDRGGDA